MQVSVKSSGPLGRSVRVEVLEEKINVEVQNRLQSMIRKTRLKGFRPGKVPLHIIQARYGNQVRQEVLSEIVQDSFREAIAQESLKPASKPDIQLEETSEGLAYTATFDVYPEIALQAIEGWEIEKPVCRIGKQDIDATVENLRWQHRNFQVVEREANEGDVVTVDFVGKVDGKNFKGGTMNNFDLELGSKSFIKGFEEGLLGVTANEQRILNLNFPEDYVESFLAAKAVEFAVTVKQVKGLVLPELGKEFFTAMGVESKDIEDFRARVRSDMEKRAGQLSLERLKNIIFDRLYEANKIDLPSTFVTAEAAYLQQQFQDRLKSNGISENESNHLNIDTFKAQAEKRVALQLIMADIVEKNNLQPDSAKVSEIINQIAANYKEPSKVVSWYYGNQRRMAEINAMVLEERVVEWIISKSKIVEHELTFDELVNNRQTDTLISDK